MAQNEGTYGKPFIPWGNLKWSVMDQKLLKIYPHVERGGLQLADVVASSFFKAADKFSTGSCDPRFAKALKPRMAKYKDRPSGQTSGYGVKLLPNMRDAKLLPEQEEIFSHYGYPRQWWDPDSFNRKRN